MFQPQFTITPKVAQALMQIEAARQAVVDLPITAAVISSLQETARLMSTHYSTMIEGNRLTQEQVEKVIVQGKHFIGRERDEAEILGYYKALEILAQIVTQKDSLSEKTIQRLHGLIMAKGKENVRGTPYRNGQNVIRDSVSGRIVYLPPEAKDVPALMQELLDWLKKNMPDALPCPLVAGIAHYQFATIHPYYDGNGRTARLLTTLIMHLGGYDLKGLYSLEEYYARDLNAYYKAIDIGPSHNYYMGRAEADVTEWIEYFIVGMAESFKNIQKRALQAEGQGQLDQSDMLRKLDPRQRKILTLFQTYEYITAKRVADFFGLKDRSARNICADWVSTGFIKTVDTAKKSRKYALNDSFMDLLGN